MIRLLVTLAATALPLYFLGSLAWRANKERTALVHIEGDGWWTNGTVVAKDCEHHSFKYCFDVNASQYCGDDSTRPCDSVGIGQMVTDLRYWKQDPSANCLGAPSDRIEAATLATFGLVMLMLLCVVFLPFLGNGLVTRLRGMSATQEGEGATQK